jgi:Domain of Unknown Function (DUF1080)
MHACVDADRSFFTSAHALDTIRAMRTKQILASTVLLALTLILGATALAADAAEGGKSLIGTDLSGWKLKDANLSKTWVVVGDVRLDPADPKKLVGSGEATSEKSALFRTPIAKGSDIYTEQEFGDCEIHLEFVVPKSSNSGVYLMGRYEVQVLDSFGTPDDKLGQGDVGAIYSAAKPASNAAKEPGEWQTFDIIFQAPRFEGGKKTQNAKFLSVKLNGKEIQKNVEVKAPTGGQLYNDEKPTGPLLFQGDHGIVAFRNVRVKENKQ